MNDIYRLVGRQSVPACNSRDTDMSGRSDRLWTGRGSVNAAVRRRRTRRTAVPD